MIPTEREDPSCRLAFELGLDVFRRPRLRALERLFEHPDPVLAGRRRRNAAWVDAFGCEGDGEGDGEGGDDGGRKVTKFGDFFLEFGKENNGDSVDEGGRRKTP